jgi:hypothetical protein
MCREHNDVALIVQGACTDQVQKRTAGDSRLNAWIFKVLGDRRLNRKAVDVAFTLRDAFDMRAGFSSPSFRSISAATGLSRGSTERAVRMLTAAGHVLTVCGGGGPGNSNIYHLTGGPR